MELKHIELSAQDIARLFWEADYAPSRPVIETKLETPLEENPKTDSE
jgi:hypothetical protein